tara:strand:- start:773 stop:1636 length:864 start_codon:yes stop_codon:yes gene_type:complete
MAKLAEKTPKNIITSARGQGGDSTLFTFLDGSDRHVNLWEASILTKAKDYGIPELGERVIEEVSPATLNEDTGLLSHQEGGNALGNISTMATLGTQATSLGSSMAAGTGLMSGVGGSLMAAAGPLAAVAAIGLIMKGAKDAAAATKSQMEKLGEGISRINEERDDLAGKMKDNMENVWEGVGSKLSDIRYNVGEKFEDLTENVSGMIGRGKGLETGDAAKAIIDTGTNVQEGVARQSASLFEEGTKMVEDLSDKFADESASMDLETQDMAKDIAELSKKQHWYQNIL